MPFAGRGYPSQVKGAGFRVPSRRRSSVRIRPHAFFWLPAFLKKISSWYPPGNFRGLKNHLTISWNCMPCAGALHLFIRNRVSVDYHPCATSTTMEYKLTILSLKNIIVTFSGWFWDYYLDWIFFQLLSVSIEGILKKILSWLPLSAIRLFTG